MCYYMLLCVTLCYTIVCCQVIPSKSRMTQCTQISMRTIIGRRGGENRHSIDLCLFAQTFCEFEVSASQNQISIIQSIDGSVLLRPNSCEVTIDRSAERCKECERSLNAIQASFFRVQKLVSIIRLTDINHKLAEFDTEVLRRFRKSNCGPRDAKYWHSEPFLALQQKVTLVLEKQRWVQKWRESSLVDGKLCLLAKDLSICKNNFFPNQFYKHSCICCPSFLIISLQFVSSILC